MKKTIYLFACAAAALLMSSQVFAQMDISNCPPPEDSVIYITDDAASDENTGYAPLSALAASDTDYTIDAEGHTHGVKTSYDPDNYFDLALNGSTLTVSGVDEIASHKSFWVMVVSKSSGSREASSIFSKNTDNSLSKSINLSSISNDTYWVNIYYSESGSSYSGLHYNRISMEKNSEDIYFFLPEASISVNNDDFMEKNYRCPGYYLTQIFPSSYTQWVYTNDTIKGWAEEITKDCTTDYEKIKAVHDWAADNLYYDYDYLYNNSIGTLLTAEDVYNSKYSVCQGYANLSASLLRSIGIPCKVVEGYAITGTTQWSDVAADTTNHAWNEAWLEAEHRWVVFDATWDCQNTKGKDSSSPGTLVKGTLKRTYFDPSSYCFASNHRVNNYARLTYTSLGDFDSNSVTDSADVALILRHFSNIKTLSSRYTTNSVMDIDGNGTINFADAVAAAKKSVFDKKV